MYPPVDRPLRRLTHQPRLVTDAVTDSTKAMSSSTPKPGPAGTATWPSTTSIGGAVEDDGPRRFSVPAGS